MPRNAFWLYSLYRAIWTGLDWVFPPACAGCGTAGARWCADCRKQGVRPGVPLCERCGQPQERNGICRACEQHPPAYRALRSWLIFDGPIRNALHRLKYRRDVGLGDALAEDMAGFARELGWPIDLVVPIPLGRKRIRERGYNQIGLVARPLAMALGWRYAPGVLRRARETRSQVGLTAEERRDNVQGAFLADPGLARGKTLLLMDDVATTGATLAAAARALLDAGAREVFCVTIARALPRHGLRDV